MEGAAAVQGQGYDARALEHSQNRKEEPSILAQILEL